MQKKILITSALPYVNNEPHLGNITGCVLPADVYNRYCKQQGKETIYICGADEYGTCTLVKAQEEKVTPKELCDKYIELHKQIYKWFNIEFDYFGRTSTTDPFKDLDWAHTKISQDIFRKLADNDYLIEQDVEQLFCEELNTFVADRYAIGTCPKCLDPKAKGDQCDKCGILLNAIDLLEPKYKFNDNFKLIKKTTSHLFLDLPKLEPQIRDWYNSVKKNWADNAINITDSWLKEGIKPRCITRDFKWGTPVPDTKKYGDKYKDKIMYNWFDAPIGYLSITANYISNWEDWWKNPNDVHLVNFFAKDNCIFHSIIFPASLLGTGDKYTLVSKIASCEYLNYAGGKFSKSEGTGVFGSDAMNSGISVDAWRFYLVAQRPETRDTEFSWEDFGARVNASLANNLGNFVTRVISLVIKYYNNEIPKLDEFTELDKQYIENINNLCKFFHDSMEKVSLRNALNCILDISHNGNKYIMVTEPWNLFKNDYTKNRCSHVMHILIHTVGLISRLIDPFMPNMTKTICNMLNDTYSKNILEFNILTKNVGHVIMLFNRISDSDIKQFKKKFG